LATGTSTTARASISGTPTGATTIIPTITTTQTSNTTVTPTVTPTTNAGSGILITESLSLGSTGQEVLALQQFLIDNGYLSTATPTTYFGSLTQTALQKFQCDHSIICSGSPTSTGYGGTGPKTRAAINAILSGGGGGSSNSTTSDDAHIAVLRALIASLLQQLAVLQAKLAALNTPIQTPTIPTIQTPTTSTLTKTTSQTTPQPLTDKYVFSRYLSLGMSGHDVEELQYFLNTRGFNLASSGPGSRGEETSYFGTSTRQALSAYQDRRYIVIDDAGYFGEHTREAVNGEMGR
jgi:peptidoglycan hydrolase-like protein with peptidoglycan-binding domain